MILCPASQLKPVAVEWLWPGYLLPGSVAVLDGDGGLGKSLITLDLCSRISRGDSFADGAAGPPASNVLLLCSEDRAGVIVERLRVLGADMDRVFPWTRETEGGLPSLPTQIPRLDAELKDVRPRLVVIDPIVAFLDGRVNLASEASVRRALDPLQNLAERHQCAILFVRHLNKAPGSQALYRGMNSVAFVSVCRVAWLVGRDPRDPSRCVLAQNKNNYAPLQASLTYRFAKDSPRITWLGPSPLSADDLLRNIRSRRRQQVVRFLRNLLEAGGRTKTEVERIARAQGFSDATLRRAREELALRHARVLRNGKSTTYWLLPGQALPKEAVEGSGTEELEEYLRRLEQEYPPSNSAA